MHIENLQVFLDLVESKSFSQAARMNGVTQSAVSQQLRSMEKRFEALIIDRSQKQFRLTPEGQRLYDTAREILHSYNTLCADIEELRNVVSGTVRLATIYSVGLHELPSYLKKFMQEYPDVNIHVEYRRSNHVYEDLQNNAVDLGLVAYPEPRSGLEVVPFQHDRLVVVAQAGHPLAARADLDPRELADQDLVGFDPDIPTRQATDQILAEAGVRVEPKMVFDNIETVKRAVEIGAGLAVLPEATVEHEERNGLLSSIPFRDVEHRRPIALLYRKDRVLTPAMRRFVELLGGWAPRQGQTAAEAEKEAATQPEEKAS
jgi:DNA-binding transcriptional LysR family regulator